MQKAFNKDPWDATGSLTLCPQTFAPTHARGLFQMVCRCCEMIANTSTRWQLNIIAAWVEMHMVRALHSRSWLGSHSRVQGLTLVCVKQVPLLLCSAQVNTNCLDGCLGRHSRALDPLSLESQTIVRHYPGAQTQTPVL